MSSFVFAIETPWVHRARASRRAHFGRWFCSPEDQFESDGRSAAVLLHALFAGILVMPCFLISYIVLVHRLPWGVGTLAAVVLSLAVTVAIFRSVRGRFGLRLLHFSTLIPVVLSVAALIRMGGVALDEENSTRPVAAALARTEAGTTNLSRLRYCRCHVRPNMDWRFTVTRSCRATTGAKFPKARTYWWPRKARKANWPRWWVPEWWS